MKCFNDYLDLCISSVHSHPCCQKIICDFVKMHIDVYNAWKKIIEINRTDEAENQERNETLGKMKKRKKIEHVNFYERYRSFLNESYDDGSDFINYLRLAQSNINKRQNRDIRKIAQKYYNTVVANVLSSGLAIDEVVEEAVIPFINWEYTVVDFQVVYLLMRYSPKEGRCGAKLIQAIRAFILNGETVESSCIYDLLRLYNACSNLDVDTFVDFSRLVCSKIDSMPASEDRLVLKDFNYRLIANALSLQDENPIGYERMVCFHRIKELLPPWLLYHVCDLEDRFIARVLNSQYSGLYISQIACSLLKNEKRINDSKWDRTENIVVLQYFFTKSFVHLGTDKVIDLLKAVLYKEMEMTLKICLLYNLVSCCILNMDNQGSLMQSIKNRRELELMYALSMLVYVLNTCNNAYEMSPDLKTVYCQFCTEYSYILDYASSGWEFYSDLSRPNFSSFGKFSTHFHTQADFHPDSNTYTIIRCDPHPPDAHPHHTTQYYPRQQQIQLSTHPIVQSHHPQASSQQSGANLGTQSADRFPFENYCPEYFVLHGCYISLNLHFGHLVRDENWGLAFSNYDANFFEALWRSLDSAAEITPENFCGKMLSNIKIITFQRLWRHYTANGTCFLLFTKINDLFVSKTPLDYIYEYYLELEFPYKDILLVEYFIFCSKNHGRLLKIEVLANSLEYVDNIISYFNEVSDKIDGKRNFVVTKDSFKKLVYELCSTIYSWDIQIIRTNTQVCSALRFLILKIANVWGSSIYVPQKSIPMADLLIITAFPSIFSNSNSPYDGEKP